MRTLLLISVCVSLGVAGCKDDAGTKTAEVGPRIEIDTAKLAQERYNQAALQKALDSLARDTSTKARDQIAFFTLLRQSQILEAQTTLARLGYGIRVSGVMDQPTKDAIREFEHYHSLPDSGGFDVPEFELALRFVDGLIENTFPLNDLRVQTDVWSQTAHAVGTWQGADPPRQTSNIWCYRQLGTCHEGLAFIGIGGLDVSDVDYQVELWNNDELRARSDGLCTSDVLSINRASEAVILVRSSRNQQQAICKDLRQRTDDAAMRLISGSVVTDSLSRFAIPYMRYGKAARDLLARMDSTAKSSKK